MSYATLAEPDHLAAADIAAALRERVADLPIDSPVRQLAMQSAHHWSTIAGRASRRHLAVVELREFIGTES